MTLQEAINKFDSDGPYRNPAAAYRSAARIVGPFRPYDGKQHQMFYNVCQHWHDSTNTPDPAERKKNLTTG